MTEALPHVPQRPCKCPSCRGYRVGFAAGATAQLEADARLLCNLPVDEERCHKLLLTRQAWEEAIEACERTLRSAPLCQPGASHVE